MCHSAPGISRTAPDGRQISVYVDGKALESSVHAEQQCTDCHTDFGQAPHEPAHEPVRCQRCHDVTDQMGDVEARAPTEGGPALAHELVAPGCADCHGAHDIRPATDPESRTHRMNIPALCAECHGEPRFTQAYGAAGEGRVESYRASVHGRALTAEGLVVTAVCTDCHGVHDIRKVTDAASPAAREHIPGTCAKCHPGVYEAYARSIHGRDSAAGNPDAPVCTDCHGEHAIMGPDDPDSPVHPSHVAQTCSGCHEDEALQSKYGLPSHRMATYLGSYHGIASRYGDSRVANCGTCHGVHEVLPSSDPRSAVYPDNIPKTCGKCHPGAGENFALGRVHLEPSKKQDVGVFAVRVFYTIFIAVLGAAFVLHIVLDLGARARRRSGRTERGG